MSIVPIIARHRDGRFATGGLLLSLPLRLLP